MMKRRIFGLAGVALASLALSGAVAQAQDKGELVYMTPGLD